MRESNIKAFYMFANTGDDTINIIIEKKNVPGSMRFLVWLRAEGATEYTYNSSTYETSFSITVGSQETYYVKIQDETTSVSTGSGTVTKSDFDLSPEHQVQFDFSAGGAPAAHATSHEDGGSDEIDLNGLVAENGAGSSSIGIIGADSAGTSTLTLGDQSNPLYGRVEYTNADDVLALYAGNVRVVAVSSSELTALLGLTVPSGQILTAETIQAVDTDGLTFKKSNGGTVFVANDSSQLVVSSGGRLIVNTTSAEGGLDGVLKSKSGASEPGLVILDSGGVVEARIDNNGLTLASGASVNELSTDGTLAGDSDDAVPTEKAVKTYADAIGGGAPAAHAASHEDGGSDEIDLNGLAALSPCGPAIISITADDGDVATLELGDLTDPNEGMIRYDAGSQVLILTGGASDELTVTNAGMALQAGARVDKIENAVDTLTNDDTHIATSAAIFAAIAGGPGPSADVKYSRFSTDIAFTVTDHDTLAWSGGDINFADGTSATINTGNTGNVSAVTYIYFTTSTPTTLQTTTDPSVAMGIGKALLAVCKNVASGKDIEYHSFGNYGQGTLIAADNIVAQTITAAEMATSFISAGKIVSTYLTATNIQTGTLTGRTVQTSASGQRTVIDGADNFIKLYDSSGNNVILIDESSYVIGRPNIRVGLANTVEGQIIVDESNNDFVIIRGHQVRVVSSDNSDPCFRASTTGSANFIEFDSTSFVVDSNGYIKIANNQVVGARVVDARCDDAINSGDATTDGVIDSLRDAMITHGLIAAA